MRPGIDIVVVNYHTPDLLRRFLHSLVKNQPSVPWSVVIVNVDPFEADERAAWDFPLPFDYTQFGENVGYARAVNYGATFGDRETIAIFNADTRLLDTVATDCHNALQSHEDWAVLGPRQIDNEGRITHGGFFPNTGSPGHYERGFHHQNSNLFADIRDDATTVSGAAYFVKRTVWNELTDCPIYHKTSPEAIGAFLPTPHYFEETWCSYHARSHGHKVVYYGTAVMIHQWHKASPRGGHADQHVPTSREMFREACNDHGIS